VGARLPATRPRQAPPRECRFGRNRQFGFRRRNVPKKVEINDAKPRRLEGPATFLSRHGPGTFPSHQRWAESLELPPVAKLRLELAVEEFRSLSAKIKRLEAELQRYADRHPAVRLLMTIPSVGIRTAATFVA